MVHSVLNIGTSPVLLFLVSLLIWLAAFNIAGDWILVGVEPGAGSALSADNKITYKYNILPNLYWFQI